MKIPTYYEGFVKDIIEDDAEANGLTTMFLCDNLGNELFDLYYYGDFYESGNEQLIIGTEFSAPKIVAKSIKTEEYILVFDGTTHGYDSMFCDIYTQEQMDNRPLKKLDIESSRIKITLGYSIYYEGEEEDYTFENGKVVLINGTRISWEDVISNGIDWIIVSTVSKSGDVTDIVNEELA